MSVQHPSPPPPGVESNPDGGSGRAGAGWPAARILLVAAVVVSTTAFVVLVGVPTDKTLICAWVAVALTAMGVGREDWWRPLADWGPLVLFLLAYEHTRGLAYSLGRPTLWLLPADFDTTIGGGVAPTVWLQERLLPADGAVAWWEVPLSVVYTSHFWVAIVVAAVLWRRRREDFVRFMQRLLTVFGIALCVFVLMPAAPPWAAARCSPEQVADRPVAPACVHERVAPDQRTILGPIEPELPGNPDHVQRLTARGLVALPGSPQIVHTAIGGGIKMANPMAAVPSLHAGVSMLVAVTLWPRVRRRWRPLVAAYPLVMAFTLVWTADHYVFDIMAGWLLVAIAIALTAGIRNAPWGPVSRRSRSGTGGSHPIPT